MKIIGSKDGGMSGNYQSKSKMLENNKGEGGSGCLICKEQPADLIFIVDASQSIGPQNWENLAKTTNEICSRYNGAISSGDTKVSVIVYGNVVQAANKFGTCDIVKAKTQVKFPNLGDSNVPKDTYTDKALKAAHELFKKDGRMGDQTVKKLIFLLTDGGSAIPARTLQEANACKAAGIIIYSIGFAGSAIKLSEMRAVASRPEYYRFYKTIEEVKADINAIVYETCMIPANIDPNNKPPQKPKTPVKVNKKVNIKGMNGGDTRYFQFKFDKYTILALKFAPHHLTLTVYASFNQEHPSLFNHDYIKILKPNTKDTFIIKDPKLFLSDVCKQGAEGMGKKVNVAVLALDDPSSVNENLNINTNVKNNDPSKWKDYSDAEDQEVFGQQVKKKYNQSARQAQGIKLTCGIKMIVFIIGMETGISWGINWN